MKIPFQTTLLAFLFLVVSINLWTILSISANNSIDKPQFYSSGTSAPFSASISGSDGKSFENITQDNANLRELVARLERKVSDLEFRNKDLARNLSSSEAALRRSKSEIFEVQSKYRSAETDFEIALSREANLKVQIESHKDCEVRLASFLSRLKETSRQI